MDFCRKLIKRIEVNDPHGQFVQVGDLGIGFPKSQSNSFRKKFHFIRGNHDNPDICRKHPNYLGEFGNTTIDGRDIFFISGAFSIDREYRTEGVDWWSEEELSMLQCREVMEMYLETKPEIVVSHDGPQQATHNLLIGQPLSTRTGQLLSSMFTFHKPKYWIFGHWHKNWRAEIEGTNFICLPIPSTSKDVFSL